MSENHDHEHRHDGARLGLAAGLNTAFAVIQILVGLAIGSVVVLADAAHQAVDALGLITAFVAVSIARRPPSREWSYGLGKADALGGLVSALLLLGSVVWITVESIRRLIDPQPVEGGGVIVIGLIAIVVNGIGVVLVGHGHGDEAMSMRAARLHLLTDLAGSFVVVIAGLLLFTTDLSWVDPAASLLVSAAVLWSTARLIRSTVDVLLDRAPSDVSTAQLAAMLVEHPDVDLAHHVHIRSLGGGRRTASAHVVVHGTTTVHRSQEIIDDLASRTDEQFGIEHVTLQVECEHHCSDHGPNLAV
ncbi:cation diffusion facilitator family transporter [Ilumatobacter sp.]|uniref:cation diffusion facilitator family transporter n=1 Tax=Ilumatobacter sp. TaxID=1967498 RepID=UPI003C57D10D